MEEVKEETAETTKWQKVKRFFKEKGPVILGILSVVGLTAVCEARVYNEGYTKGRTLGHKEGEWIGTSKGAGLYPQALNAKRITGAVTRYQQDTISEKVENDEQFANILSELNMNPEDIFVASKVYNFVVKDDVIKS